MLQWFCGRNCDTSVVGVAAWKIDVVHRPGFRDSDEVRIIVSKKFRYILVSMGVPECDFGCTVGAYT